MEAQRQRCRRILIKNRVHRDTAKIRAKICDVLVAEAKRRFE
jgi:hypothetical protein